MTSVKNILFTILLALALSLTAVAEPQNMYQGKPPERPKEREKEPPKRDPPKRPDDKRDKKKKPDYIF